MNPTKRKISNWTAYDLAGTDPVKISNTIQNCSLINTLSFVKSHSRDTCKNRSWNFPTHNYHWGHKGSNVNQYKPTGCISLDQVSLKQHQPLSRREEYYLTITNRAQIPDQWLRAKCDLFTPLSHPWSHPCLPIKLPTDLQTQCEWPRLTKSCLTFISIQCL